MKTSTLGIIAAIVAIAAAFSFFSPYPSPNTGRSTTKSSQQSSSPPLNIPSKDPETGTQFKDTYGSLDTLTRTIFVSQTNGMKDVVIEDSMKPPEGGMKIAEATLMKRAVDVSGTVSVWETPADRFVRFENFETHNGPNLHIILSTDFGIEDSVDIGQILVTKGSGNYYIGNNIDTTKYNHVLVWSRDFDILFSYGVLKPVK